VPAEVRSAIASGSLDDEDEDFEPDFEFGRHESSTGSKP
jgi:hypothetical protein